MNKILIATLIVVIYFPTGFCQSNNYCKIPYNSLNLLDIEIMTIEKNLEVSNYETAIELARGIPQAAAIVNCCFLAKKLPRIFYSLGEFSEKQNDTENVIWYYMRAANYYNLLYGDKNIFIPLTFKRIAEYLFDTGNFSNAKIYYKKAIDQKYKYSEKHYQFCKQKIGICYEQIQNYFKSLDQFGTVLESNLNNKNDLFSITNALINLGTVYAHQGFFDLALDYYFKSIQNIPPNQNEYKRIVAFVNNNIGNVYLENNNINEALYNYNLAREILEKQHNKDTILLLQCYYNIGYCYLNNKEIDLAKTFTLKSLNLNLKGLNRNISNIRIKDCVSPNDLIVGLIDYANELLLEYRENNNEEALTSANESSNVAYKIFQELDSHIESIRSKMTLTTNHNFLFNTLINCKINSMVDKQDTIELIHLCDSKRDFQHDSYRENQTQRITQLHYQDGLFRKLMDSDSFAGSSILKRTIESNDREIITDETLKFIINKVDDREKIISLSIVDSTIVSILIDKSKIITKIDSIGNLEELIDSYLLKIKKYSDCKKDGSKIFSILFSKIYPEIMNCNHLIIIPDSYLGLLPFESLFDGNKKKYFIEELDISYSYSLKNLMPSKTFQNDSLEFYGYSPYSEEVQGKNFLANSSKEIESIDLLFNTSSQKSHSFKSSDATLGNILKYSGDHSIIHIASHSFTNNNDPWKSYIQLSPDSLLSSGNLTVEKIYENYFRSPLVTLSSCETGFGPVINSEGVLSIGRAFTCSEVDNLILSLWKVEDGLTKKFMNRIYVQLLEGKTIPASIARAKREMIKSSIDHPFIWASFIHYQNCL